MYIYVYVYIYILFFNSYFLILNVFQVLFALTECESYFSFTFAYQDNHQISLRWKKKQQKKTANRTASKNLDLSVDWEKTMVYF